MKRTSKLFVILLLASSLSACSHMGKNQASSPEELNYEKTVTQEKSEAADLDHVEAPVAVSQVPKEINDHVLKWVSYFQGKGRAHMMRYLSRSSRYVPMMKEVLRSKGLPDDLVYIALIESGFSHSARSHANAVGYWQFIRPTGRIYGLTVNSLVDERRDPVRSTEAAAGYFKALYNLFGSWYLAIASYNVGENRVKRNVMNHYTRDFWELARRKSLPKETIEYVPKFIAARLIAKNPEKYGFFNIEYEPAISFDEIQSDKPVNLRKFASGLNLDYEEFKKFYNPSYKTEYAPLNRQGVVVLRVPVGMKDKAVALLPSISEENRRLAAFKDDTGDYQFHRVKRGDTIASLARKYKVSVKSILEANDFTKKKLLKVGSKIKIPASRVASRTSQDFSRSRTKIDKVEKVRAPAQVHTVRKGETLHAIAKKYGVSLNKLVNKNNLRSRQALFVGRRLSIPNLSTEL